MAGGLWKLCIAVRFGCERSRWRKVVGTLPRSTLKLSVFYLKAPTCRYRHDCRQELDTSYPRQLSGAEINWTAIQCGSRFHLHVDNSPNTSPGQATCNGMQSKGVASRGMLLLYCNSLCGMSPCRKKRRSRIPLRRVPGEVHCLTRDLAELADYVRIIEA